MRLRHTPAHPGLPAARNPAPRLSLFQSLKAPTRETTSTATQMATPSDQAESARSAGTATPSTVDTCKARGGCVLLGERRAGVPPSQAATSGRAVELAAWCLRLGLLCQLCTKSYVLATTALQ